MTAGGNLTLTVGNGGGNGTFNGVLQNTSGGLSLVKTGSGTLAIMGSNSYSGTTAVNNGTLLVMGGHGGGGAYTVASGATLGGLGTITAPVTLSASATLSPGNLALALPVPAP